MSRTTISEHGDTLMRKTDETTGAEGAEEATATADTAGAEETTDGDGPDGDTPDGKERDRDTTGGDAADANKADSDTAGEDITDGDERPGALRRLLPWIALVVGAGAGALLSVGAFLGVYVRPTSDDWCALWKARDMGPLGITSDFYRTQNGRVTNAFVTGLLYSDGMRGPKLLPAFLIVTLGVGLFLLGREALRALRLPFPAVAAATAVLMLEALLFLAGTRSYQVLLWAPSTISHTLPSVLGVWAALSAVWAARSRRPWARSVAVGAAVLMGAAAGTLSEPFVAMSGLLAATVGVLCLPRLRLAHDRFASTWCAAWCLGLVIGSVVLFVSPGARWRRAQQPKRPLSLSEIGATFQDWARIWEAIGTQWAYAGALAAGALLGLAVALRARPDTGRAARPATAHSAPRAARSSTPRSAPRPTPGSAHPPRGALLVIAVLPVPLIALGSLVTAYGLRGGYGAGGWTYARAWTSFLVPFLIALCGYGAWLGHRIGRRLGARSALAAVAAGIAGVVAVAGTAALVAPTRTLTTRTVVRSVAWDRQDARIRAEAAAGREEVTYRPLFIGGLAEPFFTIVYEKDWVAQCAARSYGVDRLRRP
ncbi:hypothetical protein [Streptomyces sp. NPDC002825]|uniref:hypothetical protein n=1 Tax=Streptomyces sp. NPDC002825 TaxID=3154666 RepID=UPI00333078A7